MSDKKRVNVTLNPPYIAALDTLIDLGMYNTRPEVILQALRIFLREEKVEPFFTENARAPA